MINQKKKKNSDETNSVSNIYWASAVITGVIGLGTPLISFETGVFGFAVLVLFTMYTLVTLKTHWQAKLFTLAIVFLVSHRLLFYAFILAILFSCDCSSWY